LLLQGLSLQFSQKVVNEKIYTAEIDDFRNYVKLITVVHILSKTPFVFRTSIWGFTILSKIEGLMCVHVYIYKQSKEKMGKKKRKSLLELLKMELYYCHRRGIEANVTSLLCSGAVLKPLIQASCLRFLTL
jgi:hypothetical protein